MREKKIFCIYGYFIKGLFQRRHKMVGLTIKRIVSRNLFLLKVTRKEILSSNSFRDILGRS